MSMGQRKNPSSRLEWSLWPSVVLHSDAITTELRRTPLCSSVDKVSDRFTEGHGFNSCRGLRFFLCPVLVTSWLHHFSKWNWLSSMKFEAVQIHFLSDIFGFLSYRNFAAMALLLSIYIPLIGKIHPQNKPVFNLFWFWALNQSWEKRKSWFNLKSNTF